MRRRLLASLINLALGLVGFALAVGAAAGGSAVLGRSQGPRVRRLPTLVQSRVGRIVLGVCGFAADVLSTGRRGPGARLTGIRLVDARTGGPVSLWQATVRASARQAWPLLVRRLTAPLWKAQEIKVQETRSRIEALKHEAADDREAFERVMLEMRGERRIRPYESCLAALIQALFSVAIEAPALWSPLHQGVPDKLAGTIFVRDG